MPDLPYLAITEKHDCRGTLGMCFKLDKRTSLVDTIQWRIQDFPEEGALTPKGGGANLLFGQFLPKTA